MTTKYDVTDTELELLRLLWQNGSCTVRRLTDARYPDGGHAHYATVQSLLGRLEQKGCVDHSKQGRVNVYRATVSRAELIARRLRATADALCDGSMAPLLTHLVAHRDGDRIRISRAASSDQPAPVSKLSRPEVERGVHRFTHGGHITAPRKISNDSPTCNDEAREARIQEVAILDVVIDEHGEITETSVIRGLPLGLTEAAKEAVSGWRYEPATLDGEPLAVRFVVTARFSLDLEISE